MPSRIRGAYRVRYLEAASDAAQYNHMLERMKILYLGLLVVQSGAFSPALGTHLQSQPASSLASSRTSAHDNDATSESRRRQIMSSLLVGGLAFLPQVAQAAQSKDLKEDYRQGTAALSDMDDMAPLPREAYKKLPDGVIYADLRTGSGNQAVQENSRVNLQWVLRKSNGYFVDSSATNNGVPFIFTVGDGTAIKGVDEGICGMKVGGVRRLLIPPSLAYVDGLEDGKPGPMPVGFGPRQQMRRVQNVRSNVPGEYIYLEVQLTRMR